MNSPADQIITETIHIDRSKSTAIYLQIVQQLIIAIQRGYLPIGTSLPGTRLLANLLQIHRKTAVSVYDELASQGWVEIVPNKGTFVLNPIRQNPDTQNRFFPKEIKPINTNHPTKTGFSFIESNHLSSPYESTDTTYAFNDGQADIRLNQLGNLSRWYSTSIKRKPVINKWNTSSAQATSFFENQLCNFLNATRNLYIQPKNILSTPTTEMSLYIISQLLIKPNDVVLVGEMSHFASNMIFHQAGANLLTVPVDADGLDVSYIRKHFIKGKIRCIYCTSHRHYPTTATLSNARRLELLQLAKEYQFAIIEDDFDYDFQYNNTPTLPMITADTDGMIIYLGKLGQSLLPTFQTGFIVAPTNFIQEAKNYLQLIDKQGDLILKNVLAEMIYEGEIHRQLKKSIVVYRKRRDLFCQKLTETFGDLITWTKPSGGLAIWISFTPAISLTQLAKYALAQDLLIPKILLYQNKNVCAIRLGFGHLDEDEVTEVIAKLKHAYDLVINRMAV